ncbi:MAG: MJ0144 family RNA dihydrouridine synthase-like protein [Methanobrevibacter sp.]
MAGICNGDFALKLIPYGFDTVTLGGFNIDKLSIDAGSKIIKRGRKEFDIPYSKIINFIDNEASKVKNNSDVKVSVNLRSVNPDKIIEVSKLDSVDIVEINCHCRQEELQLISCGQAMLKRHDLKEYIGEVVNNSRAEVSVKIRGNVNGVDTLDISRLIDDSGADYLHVDAMKPGVSDADYNLITDISENTDIFIIGNNSIDSLNKARKMLNAGADGFSIARAAISGKLDFNLNNL